MDSTKLTREEMWAKQQICSPDVDYNQWNQKKQTIQEISQISQGCLFTVDVFKGRYDFASENFANIFGYNSSWLKNIEEQGDLLEENIHPDDREQLFAMQIQHSKYIYSLPFENRNDYSQSFQFRMLNRKQEYINIISTQKVLEKDRIGKAWIIMGIMSISPDQTLSERVKHSVINIKTGELLNLPKEQQPKILLTQREIEILNLIRQGFLSKEIAYMLDISINTINNHRKNILRKLNVDNAIEAINRANGMKLFD